jgi:hypothetical protein
MQPITAAQNLLALNKDRAITAKIESWLNALRGVEGHRPLDSEKGKGLTG